MGKKMASDQWPVLSHFICLCLSVHQGILLSLWCTFPKYFWMTTNAISNVYHHIPSQYILFFFFLSIIEWCTDFAPFPSGQLWHLPSVLVGLTLGFTFPLSRATNFLLFWASVSLSNLLAPFQQYSGKLVLQPSEVFPFIFLSPCSLRVHSHPCKFETAYPLCFII